MDDQRAEGSDTDVLLDLLVRLDGIGWQQADMEALGATVPIEELRSPLLHGLPDKLLSPLLMALRKKFAGVSTPIAAAIPDTAQLLRTQQIQQTQMQEHLQRLELRMRQRQGSVSAASVGRAIEATIKPQNIRLLVPDLRLPTEGDARSFLQALGRFAGVHSLPAGCEWVDTLTVKEHEARNARLTAPTEDVPPSPASKATGEAALQLAFGAVLRMLQELWRPEIIYSDTSNTGISMFDGKPDYTGFAHEQMLAVTVDRVIELKASIARDINTAFSQISDRFYETMDAQPRRKYMYGVVADATAFCVMRGDKSESGEIILQRSEVIMYRMRVDDTALRWLLGMLMASPAFGGFRRIDLPDVDLKCGTLGPDNLPLKYSRPDGGRPTSPRGTLVFRVTVTPHDGGEPYVAILKIGDSDFINSEADNLKALAGDPNVVELMDTGLAPGDRKSFLLVKPKCVLPDNSLSLEDAIEFLRQLLDIVERWGAHGRLHRDLSLNNVGFGPHGEVLVFDLATIMTTMPVPIDPGIHTAGILTGTPESMAISVQQGRPASTSSEYESIFYMAIKCGSTDWRVPWRRSRPSDSDTKVASMLDGATFKRKVVDQTKIAFQDLIVGFHSAIFPLAKDCSEEDPWHKKTFT